ncbi:inositol 5-phosphatase [Anaeramoeba flamelloides]|uniref:Inositol 5-phosphatase n=1 Tax=Anaeramoeba flamelloides TaxID=1746091 RepID=A0AAV7Y6B1_9EUKA|nr:inositol 5-phosphatase [Anaeramoeba flamelloides]
MFEFLTKEGFIYLEDCSITVRNVHKFHFEIHVRDKNRRYLIQALDKKDMYDWIEAIFLHRDQIYFARHILSEFSKKEKNLPELGLNSFNLPKLFQDDDIISFEVERVYKAKKNAPRCFIVDRKKKTVSIIKGDLKTRAKNVKSYSKKQAKVQNKKSNKNKKINSLGVTVPKENEKEIQKGNQNVKQGVKYHKVYSSSSLFAYQRTVGGGNKLRIKWESTDLDFYTYYFTSGVVRERFINEIEDLKTSTLGKRATLAILKPQKLKVFTFTWNLGDEPPPENFDEVIPKDHKIDLFAFAVQESDYQQRELMGSTENDWLITISKALGTDYILLCKNNLLSIRLNVFVRESLLSQIHTIDTQTEATGLGHVIGNKGGVGISFYIRDIGFCFVGCHLAARTERLLIRAENYREIISGLHFGVSELDVTQQFHYLFWFGDLNYRVELPYDLGVKLAKKNKIQNLLMHDQLNKELKAGRVFEGFQEGEIKWKPTYRYDRDNSGEFSKTKFRTPSFCDRILWKCLPEVKIKQLSYKPHFDFNTSDHKPVTSVFQIEIPPWKSLDILDTRSFCVIEFPLLKGSNIGNKTNSSDQSALPISIEFFGNMIEPGSKTEIKSQNEPIFKEIPKLYPFVTSKILLKQQHVFFLVKNKTTLIGAGSVALKHACNNKPIYFESIIRRKGLYMGKLFGEVHVRWPTLEWFEKKNLLKNPKNK